MEGFAALDLGIPRTRYTRHGIFSLRPLPPKADRRRKQVLIAFPMSPRLAYLIGSVYGDGSVSRRRLTYFNLDKDWIEAVAQELSHLTMSGNPKAQVLPMGWRGCYSIEYCNAALARLIGGSTRTRVKVVDRLTRKEPMLRAFVAGLFDTEGSATLYNNKGHKHGIPEVSIANSNRPMLEVLQGRLNELGIRGGLTVAAWPRTTIIEGRVVNWKKTVYRLRFSGWKSAVGFGNFILPWVKSQPKVVRLRQVVSRGGVGEI